MSKRPPTTFATRRAIQRSDKSIRELAQHFKINPKTVAKWRQRESVADIRKGPKEPKSSVLTQVEEAIVLTFRCHVPLPLDDSLLALRALMPQLTRSSLHRCWQRHGLSRSSIARDKASHNDRHTLFGHFTIAVTEIGRAQLIVAIESASHFIVAELYDGATPKAAELFVQHLVDTLPFKVQSVATSDAKLLRFPQFDAACRAQGIHRIDTPPPWSTEQTDRAHKAIEAAAGTVVDLLSTGHIAKWRQKLASTIDEYNSRCLLKSLNHATPQTYVTRLRHEATAAARSNKTQDAYRPLSRVAHGRESIDATIRKRNPISTREAILEAARSCLAHVGPEGLSLAEVARIAGVNRGTAYQHFKSREKLIAATAAWVSDKLFLAVFGAPSMTDRSVDDVDVAALTDRLANFAMDNPELCRAWLLQVLTSANPSSDRFWREYQGSTARFAATELAQKNVDSEVLSVIMLAGAFLWPIWARAHSKRKAGMRPLAYRFAQECLRISMYGNLRSERFPKIAERLSSFDFTQAALQTTGPANRKRARAKQGS